MTKKRKKTGGDPSIKADPLKAKLFATMRANVELVRDLKGVISEDRHLMLRASSLGLMFAYSELTGLPDPVDVLFKDMVDDQQDEAWENKPANQNKLLRRKTSEVSKEAS